MEQDTRVVAVPRLRAFVELVKPELTGLTVVTGMVAFLFAGGPPYDFGGVLLVGAAMLLVGAGAASWNQFLERGFDQKMKRTERRPIPSGRVRAWEAALLGSLSGATGVFALGWKFGWLPAVLALATLLIYLGIYTPLKRRTPWNTAVGSIPGALPVLIGWSAGAGELSTPAWIFFAILVFWQFPHFFALAWMYRSDYAKAGYRMLPLTDDLRGTRTNRCNLLSIMVLIGLTSSLTWGQFTGMTFLVTSGLAGLAFLWIAQRVRKQQRVAEESSLGRIPRQLFFASLTYLPLILLFALLDRR